MRSLVLHPVSLKNALPAKQCTLYRSTRPRVVVVLATVLFSTKTTKTTDGAFQHNESHPDMKYCHANPVSDEAVGIYYGLYIVVTLLPLNQGRAHTLAALSSI